MRAFGLERSEERAFESASRGYLEQSLGLARVRGAMGPMMASISAVGMLIVFWYGGHLVLIHELTPGDFVAFWAALARLVWPP